MKRHFFCLFTRLQDKCHASCVLIVWQSASESLAKHLTQLHTVPCFELPMPISRLQLLMQFRMGSHAFPVVQGSLASGMLSLPSPDISAAALCARLGQWGMKGILF